jgi:hypothetical protein
VPWSAADASARRSSRRAELSTWKVRSHPRPAVFDDSRTNGSGYTYRVGRDYAGHRRIRHEDRVYVSGDVHTQTIEGFFGLMKNGIRGT